MIKFRSLRLPRRNNKNKDDKTKSYAGAGASGDDDDGRPAVDFSAVDGQVGSRLGSFASSLVSSSSSVFAAAVGVGAGGFHRSKSDPAAAGAARTADDVNNNNSRLRHKSAERVAVRAGERERRTRGGKSGTAAAGRGELDDVIAMMTGASPPTVSPFRKLPSSAYPLDDEEFVWRIADKSSGAGGSSRTSPPWLKENWSREEASAYVLLELGFPGAFVIRKSGNRAETQKIDKKPEDPDEGERHLYSMTAVNNEMRVLHFQIFETRCKGLGVKTDGDLRVVHLMNSMPHYDLPSLVAYYHRNPVPSERGGFLLRSSSESR